ncbi:hypothetical protein JYU29_05000 [Tianweitania sp. BSSL-BM11]|uniref:Uncharacterized protein n=1 Tax=Tianweitania aestuarii TaxID=2814886 RepID=A0ABS5RSL4_9HYPH|nr:hypothetical protein [Tianweitania aestuarii]MBS9720045.1 hypothetical protein [Tianweitania aestuarii]
MASIMGGGSGAAKAAAEKSRRVQQVANDRQLAALQSSNEDAGATRKTPRGRRLFVSDPGQKTDLS